MTEAYSEPPFGRLIACEQIYQVSANYISYNERISPCTHNEYTLTTYTVYQCTFCFFFFAEPKGHHRILKRIERKLAQKNKLRRMKMSMKIKTNEVNKKKKV